MRNISAAFKAHLAQEVTTLCTCWLVTLTNGTIIGFTDHTSNIDFEDTTYYSSTGYIPSSIDTSSQFNVDNMDIEAILRSPNISEPDLMAGLWDYADVEIFWVNWDDLTMGKMIVKSGTLGEVQINQSTFVVEVRGLTQAYTNVIGEVTGPTCRVKALGDTRCGVDLSSRTVTGVVDRVDEQNRIIYDSSRVEAGSSEGKAITGISQEEQATVTCVGHEFLEAGLVTISGVMGVVLHGAYVPDLGYVPGSETSINGSIFTILSVVDADHFTIDLDTRPYNEDPTAGVDDPALVYSSYVSGGVATPGGTSSVFDYGDFRFTSGRNIGVSMEVKEYSVGTITLQLPMPYPIAVGDTYVMVEGCDRSIETCIGRFNNAINFRGEPHLPGQDKVIRFGGVK